MKTKTDLQKYSGISSWQIFGVMMCAAFALTVLPDLSFADGGSSSTSGPFDNTLCTIKDWFSGPTGRAIATIAVIFLGIAAFFGKVTWGLALMFAVGIFAIFGASEIVNAISGGNDPANCS